MVTIDILSIDKQIENKLFKSDDNIKKLQIKKKELEKTMNSSNINQTVRSKIIKQLEVIKEKINNIKNNTEYNFYKLETINLLTEYRKILNKPKKISFLKKNNKMNKEKKNIIEKYIKIASKYININNIVTSSKNNLVICNNCSNKKSFEVMNKNIYICKKCYSEQRVIRHNSSYNDIDRVNISSKYMYDRKIHFRDCIKQYQGKQNCNIPQIIYDKLEEQFILHHLCENNYNTRYEKFKNITKKHILIFLKDLGYSNHYENVHLIHYNFTGIKPDDISHLENKLLEDFDNLTDLYDKIYKNIKRKNFINTQYVLYQLLRRHRHKCKKEEFVILKTIDRKFFHDEICKNLFERLGWNSSPFY